ncbi:YphA family membrane protein [Metabacillus arenae]|uniref:Uncharacterized protein n=1 Tax=Metabacillus arenae TaxID=2771434 RepID=A0A926NI90_9BACI|nr:hypothetical protein [Metabacillus arenae]MBD1378627.1 hypothetical protein [Metabacillus arenae]
MEGTIYYWLMWAGWITATFLLKKNKQRTFISLFILLNIIVSPHFVKIHSFYVNSSYFLFFFISLIILSAGKYSRTFRNLLLGTGLSFGYAGILLFELYDPVWFFIESKWLLSFLIGGFCIYFMESFFARVSLFYLSICQGEFLFYLVISKFQGRLEVGAFPFLDLAAVGSLFLFAWTMYETIAIMFDQQIQKTTKEKQG